MDLRTHALAAGRSFALPLEAARLLARERSLWPAAALPFALSAAAAVGALGLVAAHAGELFAWTSGLFPALEAEAWYAWLWVGPARALFFVLGALLFAALATLALAAAFLLASLVAAPFHDLLSRRVEALVTGRVDEVAAAGIGGALRNAGRVLREELRRLAFFVAVWAAIAAFGLLVPGGQLLAGPALLLFGALFLPLDFAGYVLDRRGATFAEKRRFVTGQLGRALGFGSAALALCAVPLLNFLAMPVLVVAGTLLALRGAPTRTPTSP